MGAAILRHGDSMESTGATAAHAEAGRKLGEAGRSIDEAARDLSLAGVLLEEGALTRGGC